jgi:hypothetical protein
VTHIGSLVNAVDFSYGLFELDFREFALGDRVPSGSV